ncbi:MAG TPA: hypothetical protein P5238_11340 [Smithellaceae bacterium]|nr:hypothetical protein [Smithellaceae bacterium]HRS84067.1 hypothetical protein [Smithellaceae bacterium]HRV44527.1 hypothetical protein [Smithellaceae bacterium]
MKTPHDHKITRCPRLGDEIAFAYCLREAGDLPCARILFCWQAAFDVASLLRENLTQEELRRFADAQPRDKVVHLIEILEKAKRQT